MIILTAQTYNDWTRPLRVRPRLLRAMLVLNHVLTGLSYVLYPLLLCWLLWQHDSRFLCILLVPSISFILLSMLRSLFNAPRPYEVLDINPLIHKNTKGHSFPSRHIFSAAVIAMTFWSIRPAISIILLLCAAVMAAIRVLGGVHFPRDVITGFFIGMAAGMVGILLL